MEIEFSPAAQQIKKKTKPKKQNNFHTWVPSDQSLFNRLRGGIVSKHSPVCFNSLANRQMTSITVSR